MKASLRHVDIEKEDGMYVVTPVWNNVDRPSASRYSCGKNKQLAERLALAWKDGVAYSNATIKTDCDGDTYVNACNEIYMRHANSDLSRLGY